MSGNGFKVHFSEMMFVSCLSCVVRKLQFVEDGFNLFSDVSLAIYSIQINFSNFMKKIKIIVTCHTPALFIKDNLFCYINSGRDLLDDKELSGFITKSEKQWLIDNTVGDNTGDNISILNDYFNQLCSIYWFWKNYEDLNNLEYIGSMQYRRRFDVDSKSIDDFIEDYDIIVPNSGPWSTSVLEQYASHHDQNYSVINKALEYIKLNYSLYYDDILEYLNQNFAHMHMIFILKKELFLEMCNFLFSVLNFLFLKINYSTVSASNTRILAYLGERLVGGFIHHKIKKGYKVKLLNDFYPLPAEKYRIDFFPVYDFTKIYIATTVDESNFFELEIFIISILENTLDKNIDFTVLIDFDVDTKDSIIFKQLEQNYKRCVIRFINIKNLFLRQNKTWKFNALKKIDKNLLAKLFLFKEFKTLKRILWVDTHFCCFSNLFELWNIDLCDYDAGMTLNYTNQNNIANVYQKIEDFNYCLSFSSKVMLINLESCRKHYVYNKILSYIEVSKYECQIDSIFNICFSKTKILNASFNLDYSFCHNRNLMNIMNLDSYLNIKRAIFKPCFIYYNDGISFKIIDNKMIPYYKKSTYFFIRFNSVLNNF